MGGRPAGSRGRKNLNSLFSRTSSCRKGGKKGTRKKESARMGGVGACLFEGRKVRRGMKEKQRRREIYIYIYINKRGKLDAAFSTAFGSIREHQTS